MKLCLLETQVGGNAILLSSLLQNSIALRSLLTAPLVKKPNAEVASRRSV